MHGLMVNSVWHVFWSVFKQCPREKVIGSSLLVKFASFVVELKTGDCPEIAN